jgi:Mn-dependent DtxR family transcriptional regulator
MNNEIKLYELIKEQSVSDGFMAMRDLDVAERLGVSKYSIPNYKKRLVEQGYVEVKVKVVNNKPITLYRVLKEYTGKVQW